MPKSEAIIFRNVSPLGDLEVLNRHVRAGEEFDVTPEQAVGLHAQPDVWELVAGLDLFEKLLTPDVPAFATGGIVSSGNKPVIIGADGPEAIIPLNPEGK